MPLSSPAIIHESIVDTAAAAHHWQCYRAVSYSDIDKRAEIPSIQSLALEDLKTMSDQDLDDNWNLNTFFGTISVINLPRASERLSNISTELQQIGVTNFEIFSAVDGQTISEEIWRKIKSKREAINIKTPEGKRRFEKLRRGEAGCYLSHYQLIAQTQALFDQAVEQLAAAELSQDAEALKIAKKQVRKYSRVLIFEDDAAFGLVNKEKTVATKVKAGRILRKALAQLPKDWDMCYLVVHPTETTTKKGPNLYQINDSWIAAAYAVNHTMYKPLVELLKRIEDPAVKKVIPVDNAIASLHHKYQVFAVYPSIVYCQAVKSQISSKKPQKLWQDQPIHK